MEDVRDEALGRLLDQWASSIQPDSTRIPGLPPSRPRRDRIVRSTASVVVAVIFVAAAAWEVADIRRGTGQIEGPPAPSSTVLIGLRDIPITVAYPADWFASTLSGHPWATGTGLVVVNDRRETPNALIRTDVPGPFGTHIRDFVGVTVSKAPNHAPTSTDSAFPLNMAEAKVDPGWGQESVRYLNAQVSGIPIRITVYAAKDPSPQDLAAADAIVASIRPTEGPSAPLSFVPADGWYQQAYVHEPGSSDPSQAWTSNMAFTPDEQAPAFPDTSAIADGEVLVLAWQVKQGRPDPTNPNFPIIQGPFQLAAPTTGYEGLAPGVTQSTMLAQIDGRYVQVAVFFGSGDPSSDMKAEAQSALDRLAINPFLTSSAGRRNAHTVSRSVPTCAPNGQPWASDSCPESVWLRKVITAAGARVTGLTQNVEPQSRSAFVVSFDGYTFSMGAVSPQDFRKMSAYFSMGEFSAGMQDDGMVGGVPLAGNVATGHWSWDLPSGYRVEIYPLDASPHHHVPRSVIARLISATLAVH